MFECSICEPLNPKIIEKGIVSKEEFQEILSEFPWREMLKEQQSAEPSAIYYSPSLELLNTKTKHGIAISIVEPEEFYIFYKHPKLVTKRKWFKSTQTLEPEYLSDRIGQTEKDVKDAFNALLNDDLEELESRWG